MLPGNPPTQHFTKHFVSALKSRLDDATRITPGVVDGLVTTRLCRCTVDRQAPDLRGTEGPLRRLRDQ